MKAGPQSISYKFNCDLDQKPVPRHKIPTDALLEVEGLTAYDTDFVECSYVGQRADEAAGALVAASITANNILFQRDRAQSLLHFRACICVGPFLKDPPRRGGV